MNISVLTLFPELYTSFFQTSLIKKAEEKGVVSSHVDNLLSYVQPKKRIDSTTFGHHAGMLIRPDIVEQAVDKAEGQFGKAYKIVLSPQGTKLNQHRLKALYEKVAQAGHMMVIASRYEGLDARVESYYADEVISVGDFVLMGGDIPAMMLIEGLLRFVPGVIGNQESVDRDSFTGPFVDYPEYTRPIDWKGMVVPEVVRSGDHGAIDRWRKEQAVQKTVLHHFNWMRSVPLSKEDKRVAQKHVPKHYVALMHERIRLKEGAVGTTSVTSLDIHDIARSAATYGMHKYFIVTPLQDQQALVRKMTTFWNDYQVGGQYNKHRHEAIAYVDVVSYYEDVIAKIEQETGKKPVVIGTSARTSDTQQAISYFDQQEVWKHNRPVLLLFGTGHGMSDELLAKCDYMLPPLCGLGDFNHLSVRTAAGVIFDKWLGVAQQSML